MRIYLAGKVAKGDWRHGIVEGLREALDNLQFPCEWPVLGGAVVTDGVRHDYVGPFFTRCDHGCTHGPDSHGIFGADPYCSPSLGEFSWKPHEASEHLRPVIFAQCVQAIRTCDLFFAWLDDVTAYGTLVEIGIARALDKHVCLASPAPGPPSDLWFSFEAANRLIVRSTPAEALAAAVKTMSLDIQFKERIAAALDRCESPIEQSYLAALADLILSQDVFNPNLPPEAILPIRINGSGTGELWQQYKLNDLRIRLDFAVIGPGVRLAIEIDGHNYHERTAEQATRDRSRDRALTSQGWTTIRFTGKEVHADARACARQTLEILATIGAR